MATTQTQGTQRASYGLLLARLGSEATARFRCSLRPFGLAAQQFIVLKMVEELGPTSQSALADALRMDYSNLGGVAAVLCDRGLILRTRDERDRRRYSIALTDDGRRLLADAEATMRHADEEMLAALDDEERDQLRTLLRRVSESLALGGEHAELCTEAVNDPEARTPG